MGSQSFLLTSPYLSESVDMHGPRGLEISFEEPLRASHDSMAMDLHYRVEEHANECL
jgi:hypothetical protein